MSNRGRPTLRDPVLDEIEVRLRTSAWMPDGQRLADAAAHGDADDVHALQVECFDQSGGVVGHVRDQVGRSHSHPGSDSCAGRSRPRKAAIGCPGRSSSRWVERPLSRLSNRAT